LEPLTLQATSLEFFQDRTGYEAFINKIDIDDFIEDDDDSTGRERSRVFFQLGVRAAVELAERLDDEGKYRVLVSLDPDVPTMSLRFFELREDEPWGPSEPDALQLEEVLMIDTRTSEAGSPSG